MTEIKAIEKKQRKRAIPKTLKKSVWDKYIGEEIGKAKCKCCLITEITQLSFHCGHVIAESLGGEMHIDNLLPICELCNKSMSTKNMNEFKKMLESKTSVNKVINVDKKEKLKVLLEKTKKCNRMYYVDSGPDGKSIYRELSLKSTNGDEIPYKLITDTYNVFFDVKGKQNNKESFYHKKCECIFLIDTWRQVNEHDEKIKNFINHIDCLLNDNTYLEFCDKKGYI